jgi:integrase
METINSATSIRVPWNKGKLVGKKARFKLTMSYGTHTLRRTKATLIYRRTKNLRAVQLLLGHSKLESPPPSQEPR